MESLGNKQKSAEKEEKKNKVMRILIELMRDQVLGNEENQRQGKIDPVETIGAKP